MKDIVTVPVACKMLAWNPTAARADGGVDWAWLYGGPTYLGLAYSKNDKRPASPTANQVMVGHFRLRGKSHAALERGCTMLSMLIELYYLWYADCEALYRCQAATVTKQCWRRDIDVDAFL